MKSNEELHNQKKEFVRDTVEQLAAYSGVPADELDIENEYVEMQMTEDQFRLMLDSHSDTALEIMMATHLEMELYVQAGIIKEILEQREKKRK